MGAIFCAVDLRGFLNATGLQTGRAHVDALGSVGCPDFYALKVGQETTFRSPVGMADGKTRFGTFAAH